MFPLNDNIIYQILLNSDRNIRYGILREITPVFNNIILNVVSAEHYDYVYICKWMSRQPHIRVTETVLHFNLPLHMYDWLFEMTNGWHLLEHMKLVISYKHPEQTYQRLIDRIIYTMRMSNTFRHQIYKHIICLFNKHNLYIDLTEHLYCLSGFCDYESSKIIIDYITKENDILPSVINKAFIASCSKGYLPLIKLYSQLSDGCDVEHGLYELLGAINMMRRGIVLSPHFTQLSVDYLLDLLYKNPPYAVNIHLIKALKLSDVLYKPVMNRAFLVKLWRIICDKLTDDQWCNLLDSISKINPYCTIYIVRTLPRLQKRIDLSQVLARDIQIGFKYYMQIIELIITKYHKKFYINYDRLISDIENITVYSDRCKIRRYSSKLRYRKKLWNCLYNIANRRITYVRGTYTATIRE